MSVSLIIREFKKGGFNPVYERVETAEAMKKALKEKQWDIILCDYSLPKFNAPSAIALLKESNIDIPLIVVTGAVGEETAAECMRLGAQDYIIKGNLSRLCPAISRELKDAEVRVQRKLREIEYQLLLKSMINAFVVFDPIFDNAGNIISHRFVYINDTYERITGVKNEEVKGKTMHEVWPETEPEWIRRYGEVSVTGVSKEFELYHDPTKKLYHCNVYRPEEMKNRFCVVFEDITEHKRADEALKESEKKYRLLAENIQDVVFVMDMNLNYTYLSPSVKLLRGYEPEEAMKHTPAETVTPSSMDLAIRILSEMLEIEKSEHREINISRTAQLEMSRKDGTTVWVETKAFFVRDENQRAVGIMGVTRDITERKQAKIREKLARELLEILNRPESTADTIHEILQLMKDRTGYEAVGIRLKEGDDFPYYETKGFPEDFVQARDSCADVTKREISFAIDRRTRYWNACSETSSAAERTARFPSSQKEAASGPTAPRTF